MGLSRPRLDKIRSVMPDREIRSYPALLSTEAEARRWAGQGAPQGSVVTSGYQASPRGRVGTPWAIPEQGTGFSVIVRPGYLEHQEGRLYAVAVMALSDLATEPRIDWPDGVRDGRHEIGAAAVHAQIDLLRVVWAVISMMVVDVGRDLEEMIARILTRVDARLGQDPAEMMSEYTERITMIGRRVSAHLIPVGPAGTKVEGVAVGVDEDGALLVDTDEGRVVALRPQHVGRLEVSS